MQDLKVNRSLKICQYRWAINNNNYDVCNDPLCVYFYSILKTPISQISLSCMHLQFLENINRDHIFAHNISQNIFLPRKKCQFTHSEKILRKNVFFYRNIFLS